MDSIIGFITDLTGEKRGPSKHYRRYNVLTADNEIIQGWVFSSVEIDQTTSGNILLTAANNNTSVHLQGKLSTESNGAKTIKVSINSKSDKCINCTESTFLQPINVLTITSIKDAVLSTTPTRLEAVVLDDNETITFTQNDKQRRYKIFIIGDNSGTAPLIVYNELIEYLQIGESFILTQIKWNKIHNQLILTTSTSTIMEKATNVVIPDLNDMDESMSFKQIDIEEITCCIEEIVHSQKDIMCTSCKQNSTPIIGKEHLLKCQYCSKFMLAKSKNTQTSLVIQIDNQKSTFFAKTDTLQKFYQQQNPQLAMTSENISEYYLLNGPWKLTLSHFRHELISIDK
ncbi:unnamed protein product [Rotaria magnacalcarata]|uniref:Uncharacterized protein n=1 Tax=Rotaria magnacalcarata TaxID=392030 RepID=A0A816TUL3_9BILA|nr:unnamed protein product [Rotaria magnacalcarata]